MKRSLLILLSCFGVGLTLNSLALTARADWLQDLMPEINLCAWNCEQPETAQTGITPRARADQRPDDASQVQDLSPIGLNPEQNIAIENLAMPQSREAMQNRFGYPSGISKQSDWYRLPDGGQARAFHRGKTVYRVEIRRPPDMDRIAVVLK